MARPAYAVLRIQMDAHRAKELACRSLELNPNLPVALGMAGMLNCIREIRARRWSSLPRRTAKPRDPTGWFIAAVHFQDGGSMSLLFMQ